MRDSIFLQIYLVLRLIACSIIPHRLFRARSTRIDLNRLVYNRSSRSTIVKLYTSAAAAVAAAAAAAAAAVAAAAATAAEHVKGKLVKGKRVLPAIYTLIFSS